MTYGASRGFEGCDKRIKGVAPKNCRMRRLVPPRESLAGSGPASASVSAQHEYKDHTKIIHKPD